MNQKMASKLIFASHLVLIAAGCSEASTGSTGPISATESGGNGPAAGGSGTNGGATQSVGGSVGLTGGSTTNTRSGGNAATGGVSTSGTRTSTSTGGSAQTGGRGATTAGGTRATGGTSAVGGTKGAGGSSSGGTKGAGGSSSSGTKATGGNKSVGGGPATGGSKAVGGATATGGAPSSGTCSFGTVTVGTSSAIKTVGTVDFTAPAGASDLKVVYTLNNPASGILNTGGEAPVDTTKTNNHTLLLGLKPSSSYTVHVEGTVNGSNCKSSDYSLTTGALSGAPTVTRNVTSATKLAKGFIVACAGLQGSGAFILDADGVVVWNAASPAQCSRAHMDYEGVNMWMLALNVGNSNGEMRFVSMDGLTTKNNIAGLSGAHHDFTVVPGKIAAMVWSKSGSDPESNLVEMNSDGTGSATTVFKIGANLYAGGSSLLGGGNNSFHCNSILYHPSDDSYTIGDRNPHLYVKVSRSGQLQWQFGGSCTNAPAGASKCMSLASPWKVNHGHHMLDNGNFLVFNNGQSGASHILEFTLNTSGSTMSATAVKDFVSGSTASQTLGDVQRLSNGNTLITYSNAGQIIEVDSTWAAVQTISTRVGYADWRETLYGPPPR